MRKEARKKAIQKRIAKAGTNAGNPIMHPDRDYSAEARVAKKHHGDRRELMAKNRELHKKGKTHVGDGRDIVHPSMTPGKAGPNRSKGAKKQRAKENGR